MIYTATGNSSLTSTKKQLLSLPSRKARVLKAPEIAFLETVNLTACFWNRAISRPRWSPPLVIYELGCVLCLVPLYWLHLLGPHLLPIVHSILNSPADESMFILLYTFTLGYVLLTEPSLSIRSLCSLHDVTDRTPD